MAALYDMQERRDHVLIPLPSSTMKGFPRQFYKALSDHIFRTRPRYKIDLAFFSPTDDAQYEEMRALHKVNLGVQPRLFLLKMPSDCGRFVASLPRYVVLPFSAELYRDGQEHAVFKTFLLGNAVKQLLREQRWNFKEHPAVHDLKRRIQLAFQNYDEDTWDGDSYAKAT